MADLEAYLIYRLRSLADPVSITNMLDGSILDPEPECLGGSLSHLESRLDSLSFEVTVCSLVHVFDDHVRAQGETSMTWSYLV